MKLQYDVIVVGAGHAGSEAAAAAANLGSRTLLITMDMNTISQMSCNPAVGGIAKGQIVREIDALGGQMGRVTDAASIQFRMLNRSKGPAMWSPRSQCDRKMFIKEWIHTLSSTDNLHIWQDCVTELIIENKIVVGVRTQLGAEFLAGAVVLTNGTFLNGNMHFGKVQIKGGRIAEKSSLGLSDQLKELGFVVGRMKTGTPCRIDKRSINFDAMIEQKGDDEIEHFSFLNSGAPKLKQMSCYITYTNPQTHDILRRDLDKSPLYNGQIQSIGPRYCPSIETKIHTFADKDAHQLFIEPEGEDSGEYYLNGFSSSLPLDTQIEAIHTIKGLENAVLYRPGYAIEYDYFDPTQLKNTLETKLIRHLFFAGQINGTTGYEEAGGQGLIAGINAHLSCHNLSTTFTLKRNQAYIGVLIDDLINKGVDEPYRMFTSRAEYRILLRQDNADLRLTPLSSALGLATEERCTLLQHKQDAIIQLTELLNQTSIHKSEADSLLLDNGYNALNGSVKAADLILRPNITINNLCLTIPRIKEMVNNIPNITKEAIEETEIELKYRGYIDRERQSAEKLQRLENIHIPADYDYNHIESLSTEARQKLTRIRPTNIGQASRIPGVSPNDISVLLVLFGR